MFIKTKNKTSRKIENKWKETEREKQRQHGTRIPKRNANTKICIQNFSFLKNTFKVCCV